MWIKGLGDTLEIAVYNMDGQVVSKIGLDDYVFGVTPNEAVVHQALVRQLANARAGTADTKNRGEVEGSTRKLYRQKHTGFARAGSRRSPTRRHGGVVFGPHPRSYKKAMPRKMRRLALRSVLSARVDGGELIVIDSFGIEQPETRKITHALEALGVKSRILLVTADKDMAVIKSARNIDKVKTISSGMLNVVDLLSYTYVIMTVDAVRRVESIWGRREVVAEV